MAIKAGPAGSVNYEDGVVRAFALASVLWGVVGMLVGVIIAAQLTWPELNFGISWLSYGRLRPLHTNAVIFAFGGCALMATSFHVVQRTGYAKLFAPALAWFTFWGWQAVIVAAAVTLPGLHLRQGICRAGVAGRHPDHPGVGVLCDRILRHGGSPQGAPHLRG